MNKTELLDNIFGCRWNYAWGASGRYIISLFYEKGGFKGLYDFISEKKKNMADFEGYYSPELINLLEEAQTLTEEDFKQYIFNASYLRFNKKNFEKLEEKGLLRVFYPFSDKFRGTIVECHKLGNYRVLETYKNKNNERAFYNPFDSSTYFSSLEEAIIHQIYDGRYFDTLLTLLSTIPSDKKNN